MLFVSPPFGNYFPQTNKNIVTIRGSFTLNPRPGLIVSILKTLRYSLKYEGWVNKIGLKNKGISYAIKTQSNNRNEVLSIAILKESEIKELESIIPKETNIELNISCPNVTKEKETKTDLSCFINRYRRWCILKLSPTTTPGEIEYYYNMGFRQFHCCNTLPIEEGGLSGKSLKPHSLQLIREIKNKYDDVIIIGGGGIQTQEDVEDFKKAGANHYSISTLCFHPFQFFNFYKSYFK